MSALVVALYDTHALAEQVRTQLVKEGFPTDRVELTSRTEPGQAAVVGEAEGPREHLQQYFSQLFTRPDEQQSAQRFIDGVLQGHAVLTVHPRGEAETTRALQILERARPLDMADHDLADQTLERAASPEDTEPVVKKVLDATRDLTGDAGSKRTKH